jgi:hypothetical protein
MKLIITGMKKELVDLYISIKHKYQILKLKYKKPNYGSKVFCIGYNKTGTTSLGRSLELLGYNNSSFNRIVWRNYYVKNDIKKILDYTAKFDSLDDLPWLMEDMIPILDKAFPKSKFIYLTRDEESWKKSLYNWRYKTFEEYPDLEKSLTKFKSHKKFVMNYFKDREFEDFIILDIKDKKGFKKLAKFLGKNTERESFPHFNKT